MDFKKMTFKSSTPCVCHVTQMNESRARLEMCVKIHPERHKCCNLIALLRVAKTHRMRYLYWPFSAKEPYN